MMDLQTIRELTREATIRSEQSGQQPWEPTPQQRAELTTKMLSEIKASIPFLGDHVPAGWEQIDSDPLFVDTSGFGTDHEPALSLRRLGQTIAADRPGTAYALIEHGQFQGYVARYRRVGHTVSDLTS